MPPSPPSPSPPSFPSPGPKTWLITAAASPIGISITRRLLARGDDVVAGFKASCSEEREEVWTRFVEEVEREAEGEEEEEQEGKKGRRRRRRGRMRVVEGDWRMMGQCETAIAEAVEVFGKLDVLFCCESEALIGTVEELSASTRTQTLVREQFETNFFGPVNCIKAALPAMRRRGNGHIMILTGITGHLGTPGLSTYCASGWALEGFCDSLAYEVAPFGIKVTIVQPSLEVNVLTNKITFTPEMEAYMPESNPAPLCRDIIGGLLERIGGNVGERMEGIREVWPRLPGEMREQLLAETVHAILAVGGQDNPPTRHIVGFEGVASVKEKLKTVSEELEDFVDSSCAVDIEVGVAGVVEGGEEMKEIV